MAQQVNHTEFWNDSLTRMSATLRQTGPTSVKSLWAEITDSTDRRSALAASVLVGMPCRIS
jgi:hypothetical protein